MAFLEGIAAEGFVMGNPGRIGEVSPEIFCSKEAFSIFRPMKRYVAGLVLAFILQGCSQPEANREVRVAGAMRNVMWKGELGGIISMDSLSKKGFYGLGPLEGLRGELLLLDGKPIVSRVKNDTLIEVTEEPEARAPFFVYAKATDWKEMNLPENVKDLASLEEFLDGHFSQEEKPAVFRLKGRAQSALIHVQDLPPGSRVSSPEEAHAGQKEFRVSDEEVEILGFYSTRHQGIFTHHDTHLHMHLLTKDASKMGHMDELSFQPEAIKLYLAGE